MLVIINSGTIFDQSGSKNQWHSQGWPWQGTSQPKCLLCSTNQDLYTLVEQLNKQSNTLLKQSANQIVPFHLIKSGYTTVENIHHSNTEQLGKWH